MTIVVVARFLDLPQTQVAASALRSAGLHPVLFDENQNYANWMNMFAVGGCRVAVPETEAEDALAVLDQAPQTETQGERADQIGWGWRTAAGLLGVGLLSPVLGWLVLAARARSRSVEPAMMGFALVVVTVPLPMVALSEIITVLFGLVMPNGQG